MNPYYYRGALILWFRIGAFYTTDGVNRFKTLRESVRHLDKLAEKGE